MMQPHSLNDNQVKTHSDTKVGADESKSMNEIKLVISMHDVNNVRIAQA